MADTGATSSNRVEAPRRLLVLDDDPQICETVCAIAALEGFDARWSSDSTGFDAILLGWAPSHVVVDLRMPGNDGVDVLRRIADTGLGASVIVMSGVGARVLEAAARAAKESGVSVRGTLSKPFSPDELRVLLGCAGHGGPRPATGPSERPPEGPAVTPEAIAAAVEAGAIEPYLQPKVSCATGALVGFEALARWQHPALGFIPPDRFIPVAEAGGLISPLTRAVFDAALVWFSGCHAGAGLSLALNLSVETMKDPSFESWLVTRCRALGVPAAEVTLEITETAAVERSVPFLERITKLRILGFGLSLDDYGVGYSSLVQLARLPFSEIKIDRAFVMDARRSEEARKIALATVELGRALGLHVTAEGVEDAWTLRYLQGVGCDSAQGYFIARPMPRAEATSWRPPRQ